MTWAWLGHQAVALVLTVGVTIGLRVLTGYDSTNERFWSWRPLAFMFTLVWFYKFAAWWQ